MLHAQQGGLRHTSLCVLLLATTACVHVGGQSAHLETVCRDSVRIGDAVFRLEYWPEDAETARQVKGALARAVPTAERWGRFSAPVLVTIHRTHQALEVATHRVGYAWLRAWARYASVDLQSPRTWSRGRASDAEVEQLLVHELTHCVMYQSTATERTWKNGGIPLWFREGMASVTAGQEPRRATAEPTRRSYGQAVAQQDPLISPEPLYKANSELVYDTADRAFRFLLQRYGEERIRRLIVTMGAGHGFTHAFHQAVGIAVRDFEGDFKRDAVEHG